MFRIIHFILTVIFFRNHKFLRGSSYDNQHVLVISIVIDSDRGHCCEHLKNIYIYDENWACDMIWMFVCVMNFWAAWNGKNWNFRLFRPNLHEFRLLYLYFVCKCSFREISMINFLIWDQSKPILLILKIEKSKYLKFVNCTFIIHKNGNKKSMQLILQSNSTLFRLNNIFFWDEY